jgi:phosphate/sulfate permease
MPDLFLIIVVLLFLLAITDLVVGVSNDAVNFLNSAIGSRVATRRTIMIVAGLGIFFGASLSSGMMEVARKGIFNPAFFTFLEIMILFLAVMLTDIILLDLFNTFGMPTSTTVSIVFELLGAAVALATIKTLSQGEGLSAVGDYINSSGALAIISGIFLSIAIAFTVGALVMLISRVLFPFRPENRSKPVMILWSGLAMSILVFFLFFKGLKGSGFVPPEVTNWIAENPWLLIGLGFAILSVLMYFLDRMKVSIFRIVVLFGTFSLAMAFAGNDLVNFIGVPIAGFQSYRAWAETNVPAEEYGMEVLSGAYPTEPYLLVGAGLIMILTLWFSKKARSVTDTEVNLGRQSAGLERFSPNWLSRYLVRQAYHLSGGVSQVIPNEWKKNAEQSFEPIRLEASQNGQPLDQPAFDLVRASVNLTVASALIAVATSYKLPLSTTYVSFMVAMGTSLSDRAWGRDSAVYRVAGVLNVIGGWLATALIAFTVSGTFATLIYYFRLPAIVVLVLLAAFFIFRSIAIHKKREALKTKREEYAQQNQPLPSSQVIDEMEGRVVHLIRSSGQALDSALDGFLQENRHRIRQAKQELESLRNENEEFKYAFYNQIGRMEEEQWEGSRTYLLVYDLEQDYLQSSNFIAGLIFDHVDNSLAPLLPKQQDQLARVRIQVLDYLEAVVRTIGQENQAGFLDTLKLKQDLLEELERLLSVELQGIKEQTHSARGSFFFLSLLLEIKDLVAVAARFAKLFYRVEHYSREHPWSLVAGKGNG